MQYMEIMKNMYIPVFKIKLYEKNGFTIKNYKIPRGEE